VVILTELHALYPDIRDQLLYVGLSRARHHAIIIGELPPAMDIAVQSN
jgi:ATP-dependent exoDNAse (exonuclease V) alpha subunit